MSSVHAPADVVFNIAECSLRGKIDDFYISAYAGSGGRAGSKNSGAVNYWIANNPFATGVKLSEKTPGGPLPINRYYLLPHEKHINWIRLVPFNKDAMQGRDGMAIHGRGARGSDGCIVPTDFSVVQKIYKLVLEREQKSKPRVVLDVIAVGDLDRFLGAA